MPVPNGLRQQATRGRIPASRKYVGNFAVRQVPKVAAIPSRHLQPCRAAFLAMLELTARSYAGLPRETHLSAHRGVANSASVCPDRHPRTP